MKIAIIGSGIAGLTAAYSLHTDRHDISVYEKNAYVGGHTRTIEVQTPAQILPVDTGFIVFNDRNYPLLTRLFARLGVPSKKSDMSFGVSIDNGRVEYSSSNILAQPSNLLRPEFWRMLKDILAFNRNAPRWLTEETMTLGEALDAFNPGPWFRQYYLQAMGAAIWSCSGDTILSFPVSRFVRFFHNHGLLTIFKQPRWYTVDGGGRTYVAAMSAGFTDSIRLNCAVTKVERKENTVIVHDIHGDTREYDKVIFACHADQALALLADPSPDERAILGAFSYQDNHIVVHADVSLMPKREAAWASWVYIADHNESVSLSYWMNNLQSLDKRHPIIETLNPVTRPRADMIYDEHNFRHPIFNQASIAAQDRLDLIQGIQNSYYCGAWQQYGFHEDGVRSAVNMLGAMGVTPSWL